MLSMGSPTELHPSPMSYLLWNRILLTLDPRAGFLLLPLSVDSISPAWAVGSQIVYNHSAGSDEVLLCVGFAHQVPECNS
jgi:hypothetical protein